MKMKVEYCLENAGGYEERVRKIKKKKRVLHVLKSSIYSGAENVVFTLIEALKDQYDFAYLATEGEIRSALYERGIRAILLQNYSKKNIEKAIMQYQPDIVHAHDFTASVYCAAIKSHKTPFLLISQLHYDPPWTHRWNLKTGLYYVLSRKFDIIVGVSGKTIENMVFAKKLAKKIQIVNNPIDKRYIIEKSQETVQNIENIDVLFVGRLEEQKNPLAFIHLIKQVSVVFPEIVAVMLGDGSLRKQCEEEIQRLGLGKKVRLIGFVDNPYPYMRRAKILCMTSRWEGYGLVAAEGNVLGIPVLSTRTAGVTEVFGEHSNALCENSRDMREKALVLLQDKKVYQQWQTEALQRAEKFVSVKAYAEKIGRLYQRKEDEKVK